jgi:twitching motility protein PilT
LIREDKVPQIYSSIQTGAAQGMQTLDQHLQKLIQTQQITRDTAQEVAIDKTKFGGI